jgi:hypothetical protein
VSANAGTLGTCSVQELDKADWLLYEQIVFDAKIKLDSSMERLIIVALGEKNNSPQTSVSTSVSSGDLQEGK